MPSQLKESTAKRIIEANLGKCVSVKTVCTWVFGKSRLKAALENPVNDPEVIAFIKEIDTRVNESWKSKGIPRYLGPYVSSQS